LCAWIVARATLAGVVWLYTYRVSVTAEYIDPTGHRFHPSQRFDEQPWWSPPAAVVLT
jgi:hypothetical protein